MSEIKSIAPSTVDHNPHRCTETYPFDPAKLAALTRSMEDVGCWEGIIVRPAGRRYEAAFGHHRLEAATRVGLKRIPVIVRDLSDEDMLRFMGRENGEDYRAQFLVLLETWDAAVQHNARARAADTARFLGWVDSRGRSSHTARACESAATLLAGKYIKRSDLKDLSVKDAQELCGHAENRMKQISKAAHATGRSAVETEKVKRAIGEGTRRTAEKVREGVVPQRKIRSEVDGESYRAGKDKTPDSPLLAAYVGRLAGDLSKNLKDDGSAAKLKEVVKVLPQVQRADDKEAVETVQFHLEKLADRAETWRDKLRLDKVTPIKPKLKALPGGEL